ncbi:hypothetical protein ACJMK2_041070 [Sinanodonta woodiana]|uniref:Neurotransmitter-gated ion-channel ligand-binding domain-containing protein n=1 Tax=Sinanodonta woodiana TaxID=1069815 RepID=A0ABD3W2Y0_SINWO
MAMSFSFLICYLLLSHADEGHAATWSDLSAEVEKVTKIYEGKTAMIPLQNTSNTLYVLLDLELLGIPDFDDISGIVNINTYLSMQWTEEVYFNAHGSTAPDTSVTISADSIWKPPLILVNSAEDGREIVKDQSQVRIHLKSGKCELTENVIFKASCTTGDFLYPFDIHECSVKLSTRAYTSSELTLVVSSFRNDYFENGVVWILREKYSDTLIQDSKSIAKFQIKIKRQATNYILNNLVPVAVLSGLNPFVFIVTRHTGERVGFSVTCLLAVVVLMNTGVTSSQHITLLMYYLTGVMITSASITITACFTLAINNKLEKIARKCGCCCKQCRSNKVINRSPLRQQEQSSNDDGENHQTTSCCDDCEDCCCLMCCICRMCKCCKCIKKLPWVRVENMLDVYFFFFFLIVEVVLFLTFIAIMAALYSAEIKKLTLEHRNT